MKLIFSNVPQGLTWDPGLIGSLVWKMEQRLQDGPIRVEETLARIEGIEVHVKVVGVPKTTEYGLMRTLAANIFYFLKKHDLATCADVCFMGVQEGFFIESDFPEIAKTKSS